MSDDFFSGVRQFFESLASTIAQALDGVTTAYHDAGMPYGDSTEGLLHWLQDLSKISHMEQEIEQIKQHHTMLVSLRKSREDAQHE